MAKGVVQSVPEVGLFTDTEDAKTISLLDNEVLLLWDSLSVLVEKTAARRDIELKGRNE